MVSSRRRRGRDGPADCMYIGMDSRANVGRIGGLAAALGIGAAVFVGQGVALAEPSTASSSESSAQSSSGTASSESKQPRNEKADAATDSSDAKPAAAAPAPKKKKKSTASHPSSTTTHEPAAKTEKTGTATTRTVRADATEPIKTADETNKADDPAPITNVTVFSVRKTADVVVEKPKQRPQPPVTVVTTAISSMVSAVLNPFAGNSPTAPVDSPLPWMMMAAARQEFGRTSSLTKTANIVTTSADADPTPLAAVAATVTPP